MARGPATADNRLRRFERFGLVAFGLLGLLVTLHRNDILGGLARSVAGDSGYRAFHEALGGPSTSTPHGVRAFAATLPSLAPPESLNVPPRPARTPEPRTQAEPAPARAATPARPASKTDVKSSAKKKTSKGAKAKAKTKTKAN
jgi:hypothetical protein